MNMNKSKIVVYTSLFGNYDLLRDPLFIDKNVEYHVFTDNTQLKSNHWKVNWMERTISNPRRMSRLPKLLPHKYLPVHDVSVYMDACMLLKTEHVPQMIEDCLEGHDMAIYKHSRRNCTYREIDHCVRVNKETAKVAEQVKRKYIKEGFPYHFGLFECGFIIRRNTEKIKQFNEMWWQEYQLGSERDQASIMYCIWKLGLQVNAIKMGDKMKRNPYVRCFKHHEG